MTENIAEKLATIVKRLHEYYLKAGYHTFDYWIRFGGETQLAEALIEFVEELYPTEWAAAWEPYANDTTVLSRAPRLVTYDATDYSGAEAAIDMILGDFITIGDEEE